MGMDREPYYGAAAILRLRANVPHILLVDHSPRNMGFRDQIQTKCPGGTSRISIEEAVRRETKEETGLIITQSAKLRVAHRTVIPGTVPHVKAGLVIYRDQCEGKLSTISREDENSTVGPPYEVSLEDAIKKVFYKEGNHFHLHFLVRVWELREILSKEMSEGRYKKALVA